MKENDWLHNFGAAIVTFGFMMAPVIFTVNLTYIINMPPDTPIPFLRLIGVMIPGGLSVLVGLYLYSCIKDGR